MVNTLGPQYSPLRPNLYPWIFISCDLLSLILQAAGGGTAATAKGNHQLAIAGGNVMLAGIVWQVFTLIIFAGLCGEYFRRVYVHRYNLDASATAVFNSTNFRLFLVAISIAFTTIFTRCVFRIAELADGWSSPIMQNEIEFIILDGVSVHLSVPPLSAQANHPQNVPYRRSRLDRHLPGALFPPDARAQQRLEGRFAQALERRQWVWPRGCGGEISAVHKYSRKGV